MDIKILRNTVVKGEAVIVGQIVLNVPDTDAKFLIGLGKAEEIKTVTVETTDAEPGVMETTAVPAPKKRKG